MDNLIELIEDEIDIPYIEENDAVQDGCFAVTPISTSFMRGDGSPVASKTSLEITVFYKSKMELMTICKSIVDELSEKKYVCSDLDYTYDTNGNLYRCSIYVEYNEINTED